MTLIILRAVIRYILHRCNLLKLQHVTLLYMAELRGRANPPPISLPAKKHEGLFNAIFLFKIVLPNCL